MTRREKSARPFNEMGNLPSPRADAGVQTSQVPGGVYAAIRFNGIASDDGARQAESELNAALQAAGLTRAAGGAASLAQYNDPFTNPLVRRNEVLVQLEGFDKTKQ